MNHLIHNENEIEDYKNRLHSDPRASFERNYVDFVDYLVLRLSLLNKTSFFDKFLDLRFLGIILMAVSFFFKFNPFLDKSLAPNEFIISLSTGTILMLSGSYFNVKNMQENRKTLEKAGNTYLEGAKAKTGPLNLQ